MSKYWLLEIRGWCLCTQHWTLISVSSDFWRERVIIEGFRRYGGLEDHKRDERRLGGDCLGLLFAMVLWVGMWSAQFALLLIVVSMMVERCFEGKQIKKVVACLLFGRCFETPLGWAW